MGDGGNDCAWKDCQPQVWEMKRVGARDLHSGYERTGEHPLENFMLLFGE